MPFVMPRHTLKLIFSEIYGILKAIVILFLKRGYEMQQNMMGQNIIITEPSSNLRALGRNALAGKWKLAIIAVIVYELCIQIPPAILNELFGVNMGDLYFRSSSTYNGMYYDYGYMYDSMPSYSFLSGVYTILVTGAFTLGITLFFLALFRRQYVGVSDIFLGFERFGKALGLALFQGLFIMLWTMLFIVPGVIAAIRYSQAFFILADDPNKGIRECMNESKRMMNGNKGKYFCMNLSFIGWILLTVVPISIVEAVVEFLAPPAFVSALVTIIASLFMVPLTAYIYSTTAGFYEILAGHLIKSTEPAPIDPEAIPVMSDMEAVRTPETAPVQPEVRDEVHTDEIYTTADMSAAAEHSATEIPGSEAPVAPEMPKVQEAPVVPETPKTPEMPKSPEAPVTPETFEAATTQVKEKPEAAPVSESIYVDSPTPEFKNSRVVDVANVFEGSGNAENEDVKDDDGFIPKEIK